MGRESLRPAVLMPKVSIGTGRMGERKFMEEAQNHGFECYEPACGNDGGIDFKVYSHAAEDPTDRIEYNVQVAVMTRQKRSAGGNSYQSNKKQENIRKDVDIVAILINNHDSEESVNINSAKSGIQDFWFIIPRDVFIDRRMWRNHSINTQRLWGVNAKKPFKPPLDKALNAWYLFRRKNLKADTLINGFFE